MAYVWCEKESGRQIVATVKFRVSLITMVPALSISLSASNSDLLVSVQNNGTVYDVTDMLILTHKQCSRQKFANQVKYY